MIQRNPYKFGFEVHLFYFSLKQLVVVLTHGQQNKSNLKSGNTNTRDECLSQSSTRPTISYHFFLFKFVFKS